MIKRYFNLRQTTRISPEFFLNKKKRYLFFFYNEKGVFNTENVEKELVQLSAVSPECWNGIISTVGNGRQM